MNYSEQLITPALAKAYLSENKKNRRLNERAVLHLSKLMMAGHWKEGTGEAIKIGKSGMVLDGQHRLHALIKSKMSFTFLVISGINDDVFDVLDQGLKRSGGDIFSIEKIQNSTAVCGIISKIYVLEKGNKLSHGGIVRLDNLSNSELLLIYKSDPQYYQDLCLKSESYNKAISKILTTTFIAAYYHVFSKIDKNDATIFFDMLCKNIDCNNVVYLLRKKLYEDKISSRKLAMIEKTGLLIKSWNAFRGNKTLKLLRFDPLIEEYPKPI